MPHQRQTQGTKAMDKNTAHEYRKAQTVIDLLGEEFDLEQVGRLGSEFSLKFFLTDHKEETTAVDEVEIIGDKIIVTMKDGRGEFANVDRVAELLLPSVCGSKLLDNTLRWVFIYNEWTVGRICSGIVMIPGNEVEHGFSEVEQWGPQVDMPDFEPEKLPEGYYND